ncbi:MAG: S-methyl-5'-thioadenosine phosphorylase [Syntrophomonadaceae bacterium]|jgi:5'-methylthioadenosine phosphorylase|nr:S-methyl-5'-thioadenosine phosphorylase [Syntrophomonadaceae bacterium]MDH7498620.1 S-methyl-5'-thioadenosine phosphorylase [Syntrophomonadaceae bacterium]
MPKVAIIGGTGVYDARMLENVTKAVVDTPYGTAWVATGGYQGLEVAFVARHGAGHSVPPHLVNYRANIYALSSMGVERIIATAAVGSLRQEMKPGHFVIVDQFLDFTRSRPSTFYEGGERGVIHCDVTVPYCEEVGALLVDTARQMGIPVHAGGTYVCTEGPRFETAAEIRMFAQLGGDVVGMTSVPECVLAREMGMCYATVAMVTNYAAGISPTKLTHTEVIDIMAANVANLRRILMGAVGAVSASRGCGCADILEEIARLRGQETD